MSSSSDFILEASAREDVGKGASRRLRRLAGEIPAIIYGAGKDPASITIKHKDIMHSTENEAFFSHIITLKVDGKEESVVIKDLQRHPAKPVILHADFLRVSANQAITVRVPLHFLNEDTCPGVKLNGGTIAHLLNDLEISCLPKDLPEYIAVDVAELDIGDSLHISDLKLPEGVTSIDLSHGEDSDHSVVAVNKKIEISEDDEDEAASAEGDEGEASDDSDSDTDSED